jgi:hypothetical protein
LSSGRSVVLGANARIKLIDAVVVGSSCYVNGAEELCFQLLQRGGGGSGAIVSRGWRARGKGNVEEEAAEEDNGGFLSLGGGKRLGAEDKNEFEEVVKEEFNDNDDDRNWTVLGLS